MSNTPLIEIRGVSKSFSRKGPPALQRIDALIPRGQIVGLVGPDGAGKTTLLRLIAGLLKPTEGTIHVAGKDTLADAIWIHHLIGYMPQRFGLYEDLTVLQNLQLYADLRNVLGEEREKAFEKLMHFTGLKAFTARLAGALSGGMKQKLGLACALIKKPAALLLDEASVGVDPISRRQLWSMVQELIEEGISVLWSTAYLDEAGACSTVLLLSEGKVLFYGPPCQITERVRGRVYYTTSFGDGCRRSELVSLLRKEEVIDGVIQGAGIRLVTKTPVHWDGLMPLEPRFEDGYIDTLGGSFREESRLAELMPSKKNQGEVVIEAKNLEKRFGEFIAASEISFSVKSGEIFGLLGPNGAGKSTTFKMLCGLLRPTKGTTSLFNFDLQKSSGKARSRLGYMAQKFSLYGSLTVRQNLTFFSGIYNLWGRAQREAIAKMIEVFSLETYLNTIAGELPLGFKQRLALACANMHHPEVLFLDEPTSGVDPITRREFWNHINGLVEKGITVLISTHFMDEAEYCDRIALIYRGRIIHLDTPDRLKSGVQPGKEVTLEEAFIKRIEEYDRAHPE